MRTPSLVELAVCGSCLGSTVSCLDDPPAYGPSSAETPAALRFVDWTAEAGISPPGARDADAVEAFLADASASERTLLDFAGGLAVGDLDGDLWVDAVVLGGEAGASVLMNQGDGTFRERTSTFELALSPFASGPLLADFDGDGFVDLLVGGVASPHVALYRNRDGERFEDVTERSLLGSAVPVLAVAASDVDGDGDLDVLFARHGSSFGDDAERRELFWLNDGSGRFTDATELLRYPAASLGDAGVLEVAFTPAFADLDGDSDSDLALAQDRGLSGAWVNTGLDAGRPVFELGTSELAIPAARGAALGDYDNDGDLDWFVSGFDLTSVEPASTGDGNHLYQNDGQGEFRDVTERADLAAGGLAWGSCFADFDNDGFLDLFHTNGTPPGEAEDAGSGTLDASRLFLNRQNGTFDEVASSVGLDDRGDGRSVACFDYDHDGDVDVLVGAADGGLRLWGNALNPWAASDANYVCVLLHEERPGQTVVGARVRVSAGTLHQEQELRLGSYGSQTSAELHFGLGDRTEADRVEITWADGDEGTITRWPVNNCIEATHLPD